MVLAGRFRLGVSHVTAVKVLARVTVIWGLDWLEDPLARWLIHLSGKLVLVVDRKPQFLGLLRYLHDVAAGCTPETAIQNSKVEGAVCQVALPQSHTWTSAIFRWPQRITLVPCGRGLHQVWTPGSECPWAP